MFQSATATSLARSAAAPCVTWSLVSACVSPTWVDAGVTSALTAPTTSWSMTSLAAEVTTTHVLVISQGQDALDCLSTAVFLFYSIIHKAKLFLCWSMLES